MCGPTSASVPCCLRNVRFGSKADMCSAQGIMSALPPKADMGGATRDVRFVPIADIANLFDQLVGASEERFRHCEAKGFGSLEIDHQLIAKSC